MANRIGLKRMESHAFCTILCSSTVGIHRKFMYNSTPIDQVDLLNLPSNKKSFISENRKKSSNNNNKKGQRHLTNGKFQSRTHHCDSCAKLSDTIATGIVLLLHQVNCCLMVDSCGCMRYQPYCYGHSLMRRLSNCLWNPSFLSSCFSLNVNDNKILRIGTMVFVRAGKHFE